MKKKGNSIIGTSIIITIIILIITILIINAIDLIRPFIYYQKIDTIATKYMFVIEKFGYLTEEEKECLLKELIESGIEKSKVEIEYPKNKIEYGSLVNLNINYKYTIKFPSIINGKINFKNKETNISVKKSSFSKVY